MCVLCIYKYIRSPENIDLYIVRIQHKITYLVYKNYDFLNIADSMVYDAIKL